MEVNNFFPESDDNVNQEQDNPFAEFGGSLKQKEDNPFAEFGGSLKKKSTPVVSSVTPSPLPSQPDFLTQGQKVASGEIFTDISKSVPKTMAQPVAKPTLKEAALKDRENNSNYLAALYNMVVSGAETIAGGAARLAQKFDASPIARIQETADKAASSVTGINYEAIREKQAADKVRNLVGNVRSGASSKEYEKKLVEGFDVTNGIGLDDIKALGVILPSIAGDMALGVATGGTSFAIQGYDNALSTIDDIPEAKNMSETTRTAFGLGGAVIAGVLEKLGMDNILKSGTATKYVTSKILKEASEELAKKGVKVTAEQFQKTVSDKATQLLTKTALKNTVKAGAKSALLEGATEATQEGAMDLMKIAANKIENKKIFDEEEIKNTAASRYLNSAVMGGIFGGIGGAVTARTKNLQRHIESEIKNAKTQQDIDNLVSEINQNVEDGTLSNNDAELLKSMVDENLSKPKDLDIKNEKEAKLSEVNGEMALLNKEDRLYNENLDKLNKRKAEINSYYDNLLKKSKKDEEASLDDGKGIPSELIVDTSSIPTGTTEPSKLPITEEIPEITVEGTRNGYEVIEGNEANSIGDIRQEAAERRNNGEKFYIKETVKDGKKIFTLVDTTVFDEFGRPGFKSASVTVPENARLSSDALMGKLKDALGVTDKTSLEELNKITSKMKEAEVEATPTEVKLTEEVPEAESTVEENDFLNDLKNLSKSLGEPKGKKIQINTTEEIKKNEVKSVEQLREQEQAELDSKIPNAEQYRVNGKVDRAKLTNEEDIKAFDEVYNKYDKLISPLLEKPTEVKEKEEKTFAQKDLDRAEAKKIHSRVAEMEPPSDAEQVALRYLAEGGKVSQDAINEVSGTTKRASLNTGRRELKTEEAKARDYAGGKESLDDLAHRLWEASGQKISERDIKDALMSEIGNNNTRLDASKAYLERYSPEYQEEQYYNRLAEERKDEFLKEQDELEKQLRKPLDEQIEGEASEEHINNLIKQYEAEFERENKQLESEGKGKADKEIGGRDGGKEGLKEEYEKIKSNKKKKDFVRNNLPEEFKPLADELTEAQMSEIVKSDFDLKTIKNIQDAVQKQSAAEVLQPKQEGDGGTGGERKRVEQGKQGDELTGEGKAKAAEEAQPKGAKEGKVEELKTNDKSILNRINSSENIPDSVKEKFKDDLKYEVKSKEEAKSIAKNIIKEYGTDDAVTLAESNKFHGDVNSFIFSEAINDTYIKEAEAKTPEEKLKYAEQWADYAIRFDESARSKGRFISAISDFYKKSPLGIKFVENERRTEDFKKWYKGKEGSYKEVFDELVKDPQFKSLIGEEVQKGLKEERAAQRESNRKKIEDFFDNAKLKGNNLYAVPIPPKLINGALEIMKQAVLAGETVTYAVNQAIQHISKEVKDWDKEKFRKEYEEKLSSIEGKGGKKVKEELPEDAKSRILEKFRKKLKGLDESQKEKVIRKSFKTLVENGALEYNDFKKIIAETIGYGEVTPEEAAKITKLVNDINSVDELASSIRNDENRSEASLLKYQKAKKEAEKSATELNKMVYNKTNISNRLLSIMQLNTLGIPSLVNNPVFNIWNQATVRFPNAVSMTVLDQILYGGSKVSNKLFGTDVLLPENNVVASQKEFFKKLWQGGKLSTEQLFTGLTNRDYFQKEIYSSQIHPFTSAKDLWDWKFNGKNLTPAQVADKSIQATVGLPAEIVARALNIGDKPQRFAAEGAQAAVFAKNLGLKDIDYKYFLEFPKEEAYRTFKKQGLSDEAAMKKAEEIQDRIIKQGEESTFQQENLLNDMINAAFNKAGTAGDIFKRFNMPFLKIPLNAFWSSYNLVNPEVAFLQSAVYGVKAIKSRSAIDIQQSKKWFAHGVTGIALTGIAGALVSNGIVNSDNRNETTKKERLGEKTYEQQNSINVTKLNAYLRGENPDDVKNSLNVDLKWFGNVGNVLNVEALKQEEMTPEQRKDGMSYMEDMFSSMKISSMELIENGVFSSTSGLLTAIDKGGSFADSYFLNLINMGTNIVQPAMFAQMSRAQLPYYSQQKADTFMEQIKNNLLTRSSTIRNLSGKYPPSQIGVWGDVLDRKDNFAMKLFGISSNNKDNFAQPIYEDYKKTDNTAFLPPSVKPEVNGFELNTSQSKQFEIMVGQARKNLAAPFVNDGAKLSGFKDRYSKLSEEDKVKALGIIYKMGYQVAEDEFTKLYPQFYKSNKKTPEEKKESKESSIFRKSLKKFIK